MRFLTALLLALAASAQDAQPPATPPTAQTPDTPAPPPGPPVVNVSIAPLAPPDLDSPYASPRDAARHRFQATLAALRVNHDLKDGIRGFEQAYLEDSTYAAAAYNLAILVAIDEKWDDAAAALTRAAELDPRGLGATSTPQLERLKLIASLEKSADGRRKRHYDEALLPLLDRLPLLAPEAANTALGDLGRIDPKRWESPALLAGLNGDGRGYEASAKFLEIAATNASDPAVKTALENARKAADREVQYAFDARLGRSSFRPWRLRKSRRAVSIGVDADPGPDGKRTRCGLGSAALRRHIAYLRVARAAARKRRSNRQRTGRGDAQAA